MKPAAVPWKAVNGPNALLQRFGGRMPNLQPFVLVAAGTVNTSVDDVSVVLEAQVPGDVDFYALSASLCFAESANSIEGFTAVPALSPEYWWGHVDIIEDAGGKRLSNIPVSAGSIFGRGDRPFYYPAPWFLQAGTRVKVNALNESELGAPDDRLFFCWNGFKKPANEPQLPPMLLEPRLMDVLRRYSGAGELASIEPYFYSLFTGHNILGKKTGFVPMATESPTFTVSGHDFAVCYLMAEVYDATTVAYIPGAAAGNYDHTVQLVLDEGRVRLTDRPVSMASLFGHGKRFMKLPEPLVIPDGHSLTAIVAPGKLAGTDSDGLNRYLTHLTFAGVRLYRKGSA